MSEGINNFNSMEINPNLGDIMEQIMDTCEKLVNLFDRSIDKIAEYGSAVASKVKDMGIKFLKTLGFVDKDVVQILLIKNHLNDIEKKLENNPEMEKYEGGKLFAGLNKIIDLFIWRINFDGGFYNNLGWVVEEEIYPKIKKIQSKIILN